MTIFRLHGGAGGQAEVEARGRAVPYLLQHGDPLLLDAGGQHGRRDPLLHQVLRPQKGRVLLPDMVSGVLAPDTLFLTLWHVISIADLTYAHSL
jgi:hypothetical protein